MNITNFIEKAVNNYPDRTAYELNEEQLTFKQVYTYALKSSTKISSIVDENNPIIVISSKNIFIPSIYLGIAFSNCHYVPISTEMPKNKIQDILSLTQTKLIITDSDSKQLVSQLNYNGKILTIDDCINSSINIETINKRKNNILDQNPLYVIFTSGSTGVPKGVITSHSAVVDYVITITQTFKLSSKDILGNQAPLDYISHIRDIYIPLITGCKSIFLPKHLFSTPKLLFETLNNKKVTTIFWVSSALSLCCQLNVFAEIKPLFLNKVFFTGSVLDCKILNIWKNQLPNTQFFNHYGPTEITASCTYFKVENAKEYIKDIPIGKAFNNRKVFILSNDNKKTKPFEIGEICVVGKCLALGYYKNPQKTNECFVQNPLNLVYNELMYKTGDLGYYDNDGNLYFCGRKDNQIKHMGHRVELEEIERIANSFETITESCCVYDNEKSLIVLYYSGNATTSELTKYLRIHLASFMVPRKLINLPTLPKLFNGKIDRQNLKKELGNIYAKI